MARSTYIYVVVDGTDEPHAAFTVKHEMETYLQNNRPWGAFIKIYRLRDGGGSTVVMSVI